MMILNLSESLAKPLVMAKLNMAYLSSLKNRAKTAVVLIAGVTISGTPCPRHFIVPFGAEAPSGHVAQAWAIPPPSWDLLSPMAPTTDNNARDERSVLRPNPATFLRDSTLYMTSSYAIIRNRCLNYTGYYNPSSDMGHIRPIAFSSNFQKNLSVKGLFKKMKFF